MAAFRSVDRYNSGRIDTYNLRTFLSSQGHHASETELLSIIRRIDTDGDARVNYSELTEFLRTAQPSSGGSFSPSRPSPRASSPPPRRSTSPLRPSSPVRQESPAELRYSSPARRGPLLSVRDEDQLVSSLKTICGIENEIEADKTRLGTCYDFNLTDAFKIFDQRSYGVIDTYELRDGLNSIGLFPTQDEIDLFVRRYDTSGDRRLTRAEFETAFLTLDYYNSGEVRRRPSNYKYPVYRRDDCFGPRTADEFRACWRTHFRAENQSETVRQQLRANPYFNVYDAFNSLDLDGNGRITRDEFKRII
jgi:Ca2+-binding EF-hand superfamily protein